MEYVEEFKNNYENQVKKQVEESEWSQEEIAEWIKEWIIEWTKDYLMSYYDTFKSLTQLSFWSLFTWINNVWNAIKDPVVTVERAIEDVKKIVASIYTKLSTLTGYEWAKWWSYVWTNLALWAADPAGKVFKAVWGKSLKKIEEFVKQLKLLAIQKFVNKFKDIKWVDDITKIVSWEKILDPKLQWWALFIHWDMEFAKWIVWVLESKGRKMDWKPITTNKWTVTTYKSSDWKEWLTLRNFWSSDPQVIEAWYIPWATMEFSRDIGAGLKPYGSEIKFVFSK